MSTTGQLTPQGDGIAQPNLQHNPHWCTIEFMDLKTLGKQEVKETRRGVYLWGMPNGSFVGDGEGHFLMIESMEGDQTRMRALADSARDCGVDEGQPVFFRGNRIVDDEEYDHQKQRFEWGLTPDPLDIAAAEDDRRHARNRRK